MAIFSKISLGKIILERHGSLLTYCEEPVSNNFFCFCATKLWGDEESRLHLKRVNYFKHLLRFDATSISDSVFRFNIRVVKIGKFWWEEVKISWVSQQISVEEGDWVGSRFSTVDPRSHHRRRSHKVFVHILSFVLFYHLLLLILIFKNWGCQPVKYLFLMFTLAPDITEDFFFRVGISTKEGEMKIEITTLSRVAGHKL